MASHWFVVAPAGESEGSVTNPIVPKNARIVKVPVGSPADKAWSANGTYQGVEVVMGPFDSLAAAKKASPPSGLIALADIGLLGAEAGASQALTNSPSAFTTNVTGTNWGELVIRIVEGLIGIVLVGVGLARITGAQNFVSQAVKAKVP